MYGSSIIRKNTTRAFNTLRQVRDNTDDVTFMGTRNQIEMAIYHLARALENLTNEEQRRIDAALNPKGTLENHTDS